MANEIDQLMALDPLDLSSQDIDAIITYNRKVLVAYESGVKPKKGEGPKIELVTLGLSEPKKPMIRRKV